MSSWMRVAISSATDFVVTFGSLGGGFAFDLPLPFPDVPDTDGADEPFGAGIPGTKAGASARRFGSFVGPSCSPLGSPSGFVNLAPNPLALIPRDCGWGGCSACSAVRPGPVWFPLPRPLRRLPRRDLFWSFGLFEGPDDSCGGCDWAVDCED